MVRDEGWFGSVCFGAAGVRRARVFLAVQRKA